MQHYILKPWKLCEWGTQVLHAMTTCILGWTLLRGGAPLAVARDGLAFKDRLIENGNASVTCNRDPALVDQEADQCNSAANSVGMRHE